MRISIEEARANFDKIMDAVRHGEQVTIVENDRPVVEMKPPATEPAPTSMTPSEAVAALRQLRKELNIHASFDEIKGWINEGRRY